MTIIEQILLTKGPMLSGELTRELSARLGISNDNAKQQLSRSKEPVMRIGGFLTYNQSLFYHEQHTKDGSYVDYLKNILRGSAKRVYAAIKALEFHYGYMRKNQLPSYMFSPTLNLIGHKRVDILLKDIFKLNLITTEGDCIKLNPDFFSKSKIDFSQFKAMEIARNFILQQFTEWARMINFTSYDAATHFSEFSKFQWAFVSPSYILSLKQYKSKSSAPVAGFIVGDILIGRQVKEDDIIFFIEKIRVVKALKQIPKFIPFLIVDNITNNTLKILKDEGVVVGFVNKLFGTDFSELIKILINTISNAGAILKKNPTEFFSLMQKISVLVDGKTNNLRGDIFELSVGYYHSRLCKNLDISKIIYTEGKQQELDVFAVYEDAVKICECKGFKRKIEVHEVNNWLEKINLLREWLDIQEAYDNKKRVFEFWSTGGFTKDALEKLQRASNAKKFCLLYYDELAILEKAKEIKGKKFVNILNQYFLKEPL